ncbi:hypothetical protein BSZ19_21905 [Bradyrhizobium japonicum]|uniref:DUF4376 domain-containing protein n=1 Tax=Bradyrhizobium japonicum TaxID=375 RepID=A0A1Y2JNJ8_BRAJP|nr:DUF4376 domain-containing protein [Bradyrhizobium japonicum]OSJ31542.1 hypothetical protein BSZ19_21905 [Bradyrhizobium japonicum]
MNDISLMAVPASARQYDPTHWYWIADDGRIFASARQTPVPADDADYAVFVRMAMPSQWPRDQAGAQTDAELQLVLDPYNLFVTLQGYTAYKRWRKEQAGITLSSGMPIKTDDRSQAKITGVYNAQLANPAVTTPWHAADGLTYDLDAAAMAAMNTELLTHINNCFAVSDDVLAQIEAGTITTHAQIDATFDAPMTQARKDWLKV